MNDTAVTITIAYTAMSIIGIVIGLIVFRSTRVGFHVRTAGRKTLEKRESYWGVAVITFLRRRARGHDLLDPLLGHRQQRGEAQPARSSITGRQFAWTINPARAKVGDTTFVVRAEDVSHGVGVYDPDGVLLRQVNVAARRHPGVRRRPSTKPGTYDDPLPGVLRRRPPPDAEQAGGHALMESRARSTWAAAARWRSSTSRGSRKLVLWYVGASTAFLFVAGLLGMLLRESQADIVRIEPGVLVRDHDRARARRVRRVGRLRGHGLSLLGARRRSASRCAARLSRSRRSPGGRW